jgi:outer membrane lipoprotein-sorting protein
VLVVLTSPGLSTVVTIQALQTDYQEFSEYSDLNLWQNRCFPNNMSAFPRLTFAVSLLFVAVFVDAAPPKVTGNRPVLLEVPVPETEPGAPQPGRQTADDRDFLAAIFPDEPAPAGPGAATAGQNAPAQALKQARNQLLKSTSFSATVVEKVEILDKSYKAEGRYLQTALKPNDWHMRMELVVKVGDAEGALLEVCDGEVLWTRVEVDMGRKKDKKDVKEASITRRNVAEIMSAARKLGDPKTETTLIATLGLGGLPALLAAIEQEMEFTEVSEAMLRDRPMTVVHGIWSEAFTQKLTGTPQGQPRPSILPAFVPDAVRVYIDRETGFPHRVQYLKKLVGRGVFKPLLTLDFLDVSLNEPINPAEFDYKPPEGVTPVEQTKAFVDMLTSSGSKPQSTPAALH